ncbi:hypothetical protein ACOSP7_029681 [Xanthoceras sorbifolium]
MKDFFVFIYIYMHGVTAATNPYDNLCILLCICYSCWFLVCDVIENWLARISS